MPIALLALVGTAAGAAGQSAPSQLGSPSQPLIAWQAGEQPKSAPPAATVRKDQAVAPAVHTEIEPLAIETTKTRSAEAPTDPRRLAPQSSAVPLSNLNPLDRRSTLPISLPQLESLTTAGAGLAMVVGLFLLCAWLVRRSGPKPTSPLPKEAVAVLGRVPLAGSHFAHLLQLGNKLVLVSVSPDSVTALAEVTDPNEVQRLLSFCLRNHKHSSSAEFHQVLEQLASEPGGGFLGSQTSSTYARAGRT